MIRKKISVLIAVCFFTLMIAPSTVNAASTVGEKKDIVLPMYTDTSRISCDMNISGSVATIYASVRGSISTVTSCSMKIEFQEKAGIVWITKYSWNIDGFGNELSVSKDATVSSGKSYRVKVTSTVYTELGSERASAISNTQVAP